MRVKNWDKFQHYKHRDPPWIRLYRGLLNDREWHNLDGECAKALVMMWLIASESDGDLPDIPDLAFRLRLSPRQVESIVSKLNHWLEHDASTPLAPRLHDATPETETETETERGGALRAPSHPRKERKRATQLPDAFAPDWEAAFRVGLSRAEAERELVKFKNHAAQNGRVCVNWQAAWANWCIKAAEFLGRSPPSPVINSGFYAKDGSPELEAWKEYKRSRGEPCIIGGRSGGGLFPTRWPPGHENAEAA